MQMRMTGRYSWLQLQMPDRLGHLHLISTPLVRVTTYGGFRLEVVQDVISADPPWGAIRS